MHHYKTKPDVEIPKDNDQLIKFQIMQKRDCNA